MREYAYERLLVAHGANISVQSGGAARRRAVGVILRGLSRWRHDTVASGGALTGYFARWLK